MVDLCIAKTNIDNEVDGIFGVRTKFHGLAANRALAP